MYKTRENSWIVYLKKIYPIGSMYVGLSFMANVGKYTIQSNMDPVGYVTDAVYLASVSNHFARIP